MNSQDGLLNLYLNVPDAVKAKLMKFSKDENMLQGKVELVALFGINGERVKQAVNNAGGSFEDLGYGFGIITVSINDVGKIYAIKEIQYIELPKTLYTSFLPSNDASCITDVWNTYGLTGEGVIVGFIDSGIDYLHPAFIDDQGNTRIEYISDFNQNKVWNKTQINAAIKSQNPYSIVPETDEVGHGTHVAGIACAGGKIDKRYYGAAYKSSIIMVKMTPSGKVNFAKSTQLMRGVKFLIDKEKELGRPMVINLSFSTNDGAHDGESLLEQYIRTITQLEKISFVIASGNEGNSAHHVGKLLTSREEITFNVAGDETSLILQLYKDLLNNISLQIKNPAGQTSNIIRIVEGYTSGNIGNDNFYIYYTGPKPVSVNGEIIISFVAGKDFLLTGTWTLTILLDNSDPREYDIWMPVSEGLNKDTKFLTPNPFDTLGIPATVDNVISVGSYNFRTNSISSFSGRGRRGNENNKPDIVAPGENIESAIPGGGFDSLSGTSMAAPQVSGACALFMQWGIVLGNDPFLYGDRLKYYLLKGARRDRPEVTYPDAEWGYGALCLKNSIDLASVKANTITAFNKLNSNHKHKRNGKTNIIASVKENFDIRQQGSRTNPNNINQLPTPNQLPSANQQSQTNVPSQQINENQTNQINQSTTPNQQPVVNPPANLQQNQRPLTCTDLYLSEDYRNYIVEYEDDIVSRFKQIIGACVFIIDENYAVVSIKKELAAQLTGSENSGTIFENVPEIVYVQRPALYTLSAVSPLASANIYKFHDNPYLQLTGQGVLAGIVDTGIDYLNTEFMYEDDTTKIVSIWDQTIQNGKKPAGFEFGTEYTRKEINSAIQAKKAGKDPYAIVNSRDEIGHGTEMAGIIGARGKNVDIIGAAPDCELVIVKLKEAKKANLIEQGVYEPGVPVYENSDFIFGIKYLYNVCKELNRPMIVLLPLESNNGSHSGSAIIERYVDELSKSRGFVVVTGCGNQGNQDTHTGGKIAKTGDMAIIELNVDEKERDLVFNIWINKPDKVSLGVVSPTGEVIEKIPARLQQTDITKLVFEGSSLSVSYYLPEEITGDELIKVTIRNIRGGIWQFRLYGDFIVDGKYDAWLRQRALLKGDTRFLNPSPYITLTLPSTSTQIISVAFYDQNNNTIVTASGRGYTRDNRIKPDIAAGGVNVLTTSKDGGTITISGSSAAAAVTAGAIALLLEWGIVKGNDISMYSIKIKTYLIRGAQRRVGDIYPNPEWGYGTLDLNGVFENIRSVFTAVAAASISNNFRRLGPKNISKKNIYINIPDELKKYL